MRRVSLSSFYGTQVAGRIRGAPAPRVVSSHGRVYDSRGHVSGFGDAVDLSPEGRNQLASAMDGTIQALQAAVDTGRKAVARTTSTSTILGIASFFPPAILLAPLTTSSDAQDSVLGGLDQMNGLIQHDLIDQQASVLNGTLDPSKWQAAANEIKTGIGKILDGLQEGSASAILASNFSDQMSSFADALKKVKQVVQQVAQQAADTAKTIGKFTIIGGIVLAGIALWIVVPMLRSTGQAYLTAPLRVLPPPPAVGGWKRKKKRRSSRR